MSVLTDVSLFQFPEETCVDDNDRELSALCLLVITSTKLLQNFYPTFNFLSFSSSQCGVALYNITPVNAAATKAAASQSPAKTSSHKRHSLSLVTAPN